MIKTKEAMKKYFLIIITLSPLLLYGQGGQVANLDKLPQPQRDSILLSIVTEAILKYGPDFYDGIELIVPTITKRVLTKESEEMNRSAGAREGRIEYTVTYLQSKEYIEKNPYAAPRIQVRVWEDIGKVSGIMFEGFGLGFTPEYDHNRADHYVFVPSELSERKRMMQKNEYEVWKRDRTQK